MQDRLVFSRCEPDRRSWRPAVVALLCPGLVPERSVSYSGYVLLQLLLLLFVDVASRPSFCDVMVMVMGSEYYSLYHAIIATTQTYATTPKRL